ncbi:inorganic phosphate transporter [Dehalobacter sp. TeCB1]|uniref:inorganic phosphate transporter n=1 Tax=Dehalobacter sp. TeCB1 TaxID=1843715 RepID=UPI00083B2AB2|nr:inorganic phosphate transporter [Dehalobacter sp. TeCB1]OCZ53769.1 inorganic phosphate transporter [Dehalobacter sp. TeCB1]
MSSLHIALFVVVLFALAFDFINGFHDTANAIATSVSTRALTPRTAIIMAAVLNFIGAMYSTGVAKTIAKDIVDANSVTSEVMIAALIGAIFWNLLTWYFGIPSSSSHAIIGGILGAGIAAAGLGVVQGAGIKKIILALLCSPLVGMGLGYLIMTILYYLFRNKAPMKTNSIFRRLQMVSAAFLAFNHGSNDAQKSMGIITLALVAVGVQSTMDVPLWVKLLCGLAIACGTAVGGWRIIHTLGAKIFKIEPINGFAADLSSSIVIWVATAFPGLHLPVSTTHVVSGSIMGVGAAKRISAVRWGVAQQMLMAWCLTIPSTAIVAALSYHLITLVERIL